MQQSGLPSASVTQILVLIIFYFVAVSAERNVIHFSYACYVTYHLHLLISFTSTILRASENSSLLGCDAVYFDVYLPTFRQSFFSAVKQSDNTAVSTSNLEMSCGLKSVLMF